MSCKLLPAVPCQVSWAPSGSSAEAQEFAVAIELEVMMSCVTTDGGGWLGYGVACVCVSNPSAQKCGCREAGGAGVLGFFTHALLSACVADRPFHPCVSKADPPLSAETVPPLAQGPGWLQGVKSLTKTPLLNAPHKSSQGFHVPPSAMKTSEAMLSQGCG